MKEMNVWVGPVVHKSIWKKWNEMNRALGHLCAHIGLTGPGEPPEDGEMTLTSRHKIRNSSPEVWGRERYLSVTEAPHNTEFYTWMGKKHFVSFKPPIPGTEPRTLAWKAAVLTTTLGPPPINQSEDFTCAVLFTATRWRDGCNVEFRLIFK